MSKQMLINVTHAEESRVGIITNGVLSAFEIESFSREHLKGNIYRGVVHRIHPALEAAFVDIGADRNAFLPLDEICFRNLPNPPERGNGGEGRRPVRIQEILKPGDEILVQIVKEEFGNKPPTLSTFYSLPGRYLVLLPGSDDAGISRRIEGDERQRIRDIVDELKPPEGFGIIVRTVAGGDQGALELERDLSYLLRLWDSIRHTASNSRAPAPVYREHDLVLRNIRDYFTPDVDEIWIDNEEVFERAREFLREVMPGKERVLHLYDNDKPIFSQFAVEEQIESIYKRRVTLRSGGSIVVDGTEALTAIDVNSGRSTRGSNQEDTAFKTNREAALEIARQLRLRDVGGLIVIDFIDMRSPQHIAEVERTLRQAMHEDKARHEIGRISQFGLLEVSRQRLRPAAAATSYVSCAMCEGYGLVRTTESAALVGLRKIHNRVAKGDVASMRAVFPTEVGLYLLNQKREDLAQLERRCGTRIQIAFSDHLMPHQFESEVRLRSEGEQQEQRPLRLGGVAPSTEADTRSTRGPAAKGEAGAPKGRSRRGGAKPAAAAAAAPEALSSVATPAVTPAAAAKPAATPPDRIAKPAATPPDKVAKSVAVEAPTVADENASKRPRRRRGRRRGRGTGTQAAISLVEALLSIAAASPLLVRMTEAAAAEAASQPQQQRLAFVTEIAQQDDDYDDSEGPHDSDDADESEGIDDSGESYPGSVGAQNAGDDRGIAESPETASEINTEQPLSEEADLSVAPEPAAVVPAVNAAANADEGANEPAARRKRSTRSRARTTAASPEQAAPRASKKKTASKTTAAKKKSATTTKKRAAKKKTAPSATTAAAKPSAADD